MRLTDWESNENQPPFSFLFFACPAYKDEEYSSRIPRHIMYDTLAKSINVHAIEDEAGAKWNGNVYSSFIVCKE